jgi:uncharacterized protein YjeT (DUF2065 family)
MSERYTSKSKKGDARYNKAFKVGYLRGKIETQSPHFKGRTYSGSHALEQASAEIEKHKDRYNPNSDPQSKGYALSVANRLLNNGTEKGNIWEALEGASIYEQMGYGNRPSVHRRLVRAFEKDKNKSEEFDEGKYEHLVAFKKRNQPVESSALENATAAAAIICLSGALYMISPTLTGKAVADLSTGNSSLFGIILFAAGLIASYVWADKKSKRISFS